MTTTTITIEEVGSRLYVAGNSYAIKDRLKSIGCHWDSDRKQWWIGKAKRADLSGIIAGVETAESGTTEAKKEEPGDIKIVGKAKYKGRTYYVRYVGQTKRGYSCRLVTLDAKVDFWATCAQPGDQSHDGSGDVAVIIKTYSSRTDGYGRHAREVPMTLRSIQRFIERQANPDTRRGECTECGSYGPAGESCRDCGGEGHYV